MELKAPHARRIELVPNGVDAAAFQRALAAPRSPATSDLQPATCHPPSAIRLGYSGHVSSRLDLLLLRKIALARPDWQLAFAGSEWDAGCAEALQALKALPNVQFLGLLPVEEVPSFIVSCDVCLIPYRVNDETRAISSLKLYEYLAAGRPVVSARVPAAEEHATGGGEHVGTAGGEDRGGVGGDSAQSGLTQQRVAPKRVLGLQRRLWFFAIIDAQIVACPVVQRVQQAVQRNDRLGVAPDRRAAPRSGYCGHWATERAVPSRGPCQETGWALRSAFRKKSITGNHLIT